MFVAVGDLGPACGLAAAPLYMPPEAQTPENDLTGRLRDILGQ